MYYTPLILDDLFQELLILAEVYVQLYDVAHDEFWLKIYLLHGRRLVFQRLNIYKQKSPTF